MPSNLEQLKQIAIAKGYVFEVSADGTERMIRPDGSVAIIVKKTSGQLAHDAA